MLSRQFATRSEGMVWNLLDRDRNVLGELIVNRDSPPTIENDGTRAIRRTAQTAEIPPRPMYDVDPAHFYAEDIDPLSQLVQAWWVYGTGDAYSVGIFSWADDSRVKWSWGQTRHASFVDLSADLDQPIA